MSSLNENPVSIETYDYGTRFDAIQRLIDSAKTIVLVRHISPDSDAIGSVSALAAALRSKYGDNKKIIVSSEGTRVSMDKTGLVIYLDLGEAGRVAGDVSGKYKTARFDHHPSLIKVDADASDESAGSTCELITLFLKSEGYPISKSMSVDLMKGMAADNGRFEYNMSKSALVAAGILQDSGLNSRKLFTRMSSQSPLDAKTRSYILGNYKRSRNGVAYIYIDDAVAHANGISTDSAASMAYELSTIRGCPIGVMLLGRRNHINAKIRSQGIDVREVAKRYNGGGHENACGASVDTPEAALAMINDLDKLLSGNESNESAMAPLVRSKESLVAMEGDNMENEELVADLLEGELPDDPDKREYGVPEEKKFPLCDKDHVVSAIRFFNYVDDSHAGELADAIIAKMKKYGISYDTVGDKNRLRGYLPKEASKEETVNEGLGLLATTLIVSGAVSAASILAGSIMALVKNAADKKNARNSIAWSHIPSDMISKYPELGSMSINDIVSFIKSNGSQSDKASCVQTLKEIKKLFGNRTLFKGPLKPKGITGYSNDKKDFIPDSHIQNVSYYGLDLNDKSASDKLAAQALRLVKSYGRAKASPAGRSAAMKLATESLGNAIDAMSSISTENSFYVLKESRYSDDPTAVNKHDVGKAVGAGAGAAVGTGAYAMSTAINPATGASYGSTWGPAIAKSYSDLMATTGPAWKTAMSNIGSKDAWEGWLAAHKAGWTKWAADHAAAYSGLKGIGSATLASLKGMAAPLAIGAAAVAAPIAAYKIAKTIRKHRRKKQLMKAGALAGQTNDPGFLKSKFAEDWEWPVESDAVIGSKIIMLSKDQLNALSESSDLTDDEKSLLEEAMDLNDIIAENGLAL
jgi:phosphoesterase RecJ-like protein